MIPLWFFLMGLITGSFLGILLDAIWPRLYRRIVTIFKLSVLVIIIFPQTANAKSAFSVFQKDDRTVYLEGVVSDESASEAIKKLRDLDKEGRKEITVYITSGGGSTWAGLAIVDEIRSIKSPVRTVCVGYCMSMGAIILASGDIRESRPSAQIMVHQSSEVDLTGKLTDVKNRLLEDYKVQGLTEAVLIKATHKTPEEVREMVSFDHFLSAQDALVLGIITEITQPAK